MKHKTMSQGVENRLKGLEKLSRRELKYLKYHIDGLLTKRVQDNDDTPYHLT
jgi:hypothetical protein